MDVFDSRYYKINKFLLSCHGQWIYQKKTKKLLARCLSFFSVTTTLFLQFRFLFAVWGKDVDATLECLPPLTLIIMCFCQLCVYTFNADKLLILADCIKADWKLWSSGLESEILRNYAESGRRFTLLYIGYLSATVVTFITASFTPLVLDIIIPLNETRPKQLVYAAKFPFDHDKYFNWLLVHGCCTAFYNVSVLFTCDAMLAVTTQHACGLFEIISCRLNKALKMLDSKNIVDECKEELLYREMSYFIQCHNYVIRYANILESLYSPFLFFTIGGNIITISVVLIQTLNSLGSMVHTIKFGSFALAITFHVYCISLPAQNLLDHSGEVANEPYKENWYKLPEKSKKLLTMIFMQSYRPCKLTAGKIATIDMVTFSKILKSSLSYFTMLSSLRQT